MKNIRFVVLLSILGFTSIKTHAQENKLVITDDKPDYKVFNDKISIFEDPSNKLILTDILKPEIQKQFKNNGKFYTFPTSSTFWARFKMDVRIENQKKWVLEVLDSRHDVIDLYVPTKPSGFKKIVSGLIYSFNDRPYGHKNFVVDFQIEKGDNQYCYVKFKSSVVGSLFMKIHSNYRFSSYAFNEYYLLGMYYGILLIIIIYNLSLFFTAKDRIYLFYVFYVASWAFYSLTDDGLGFQYIWVDSYYISEIGFKIARPLMVLFFILYSNVFFDVKNKYPRDWKILVGSGVLYGVAHLFSGIWIFNKSADFLVVLPFVIVFWRAYKSFKEGFTPLKYFMLGNAFVIIGVTLRILKDHEIVSPGIDSLAILMVYARNIGMIIEIIILSWALGERIRFLKKNEQEAQDQIIVQLKKNEELTQKVNRELEEKVQERTQKLEEQSKELEVANLKLQEQAEEINKMNLMLDLDNRKLQKSVKEISEARVKFKEVGLAEFKEIYPSDNAVLKYLSKIKWEQGYKCKKCRNEKSCKGIKPYSMRCTKCRYDESPTAFTLLHKCKFPLTDALYIILQTMRQKDQLNVYELARELDLRKATVWSFKQKVDTALEVQKKKKDKADDQLSDLVLSV